MVEGGSGPFFKGRLGWGGRATFIKRKALVGGGSGPFFKGKALVRKNAARPSMGRLDGGKNDRKSKSEKGEWAIPPSRRSRDASIYTKEAVGTLLSVSAESEE